MKATLARVFHAYPTLLRVGFAEAVAYRAEMVIWMLSTTMPLVSLALWSAVAATAPVGRFTQRSFAAYFLAGLVVRQATGSWLVWEMNQEIRTGTLARRLLKPLHPLIAYSAENLAAIPLRALISIPIAVAALFAVDAAALPRSPLLWLVLVASLVGAWLINFASMAIIGSIAFYVESSTALFNAWMAAFMLLSGYLVPLELFPPAARAITHVLPFRYTLAFPVELSIGLLQGEAALRDLAIQWAWAIGSLGAAIFTFRAGVRRFSSYGG